MFPYFNLTCSINRDIKNCIDFFACLLKIKVIVYKIRSLQMIEILNQIMFEGNLIVYKPVLFFLARVIIVL